MATELILIRHAETEWNKESKYQGHQDIKLNEKGKIQSVKLGNYPSLKEIDIIYCSDLKRAYNTALAVNKFHNVCIRQESGLREINFGEWEGMTYSDVEKEYPDLLHNWIDDPATTDPPGGEKLHDFMDRIVATFREIIKENREQNITVVTHGGVIKLYLTYLLQMPLTNQWQFNISSTGISIINIYGEKAIIQSLNNTVHLSD